MEDLVEACSLSEKEFAFFETVASENNMSGRGIMRVLSVARTIADMECSEKINLSHIEEALSMRMALGEGTYAGI